MRARRHLAQSSVRAESQFRDKFSNVRGQIGADVIRNIASRVWQEFKLYFAFGIYAIESISANKSINIYTRFNKLLNGAIRKLQRINIYFCHKSCKINDIFSYYKNHLRLFHKFHIFDIILVFT